MDRDQLKIMEKIVSAVKKTGVNVEYTPNKNLRLTFRAKEDYGDGHAPSEISITGQPIENLHAMPPTLVPSMIACSFPYQDKQAFIKNGLSGLTGSGVEITPAITRLLEKILGSDNVSVQQSRKGCTGSRGSLRTERKESAAKCPDLRSASQNYKAVQNITNYLKSEIKKEAEKDIPAPDKRRHPCFKSSKIHTKTDISSSAIVPNHTQNAMA